MPLEVSACAWKSQVQSWHSVHYQCQTLPTGGVWFSVKGGGKQRTFEHCRISGSLAMRNSIESAQKTELKNGGSSCFLIDSFSVVIILHSFFLFNNALVH